MENKVNLYRRILLGSWLGTDMFDHHRWVGKLLHSYMGCELYTHLKIFQKCYCHFLKKKKTTTVTSAETVALEIKVFEQGFHSWSRNSHPLRSKRCPTKPDYSLVTNCKISYTLFFFPRFHLPIAISVFSLTGHCGYIDFRFTILRAIFKWVSKVIRNSFVFALLRFVVGPQNSHHSLNQSDEN